MNFSNEGRGVIAPRRALHRAEHPEGDPAEGIPKRAPRPTKAGLLVLASAVLLAIGLTPIPAAGAAPASRHIHIRASSYAYAPATIDVQRGDRVTLELESTDAMHGVRIDGYDLEVRSSPGQPALLSFVADQPGVFRLQCSVTCGPLHPFMIGRLRVAPQASLWRAGILAIGATVLGLGLASRRRPAGVP